MSMQKNEQYTLQIEDVSSDGNGVGHVDGVAVFVPETAVGDVATVKIVKVQRNYAFGIVTALELPSLDRTANDCPAFPQCGGCDFRHLQYQAELIAKRNFVENALRRIGGLTIEVVPVLTTGVCSRYRNKVQYPVCMHDGKLAVGFYAKRSHRIVPIDDCLLQSALLNTIAQCCCDLLTQFGVEAYDEQTQRGLLRHLFLRQSRLDGSVLVCLILNGGGFAREQEFAVQLQTRYPAVTTVVVNTNKHNTNVILGKKDRIVLGTGFLQDTLCGVPVRLSARSFFQVNHGAATLLYETIAKLAAVQADETVLDLYCGAGTIGLSLARQCRNLIGVEIVPQAVQDARHNAAEMGLHNCEFMEADAGKAAALLAARAQRIDVAIVDPPRKGCDQATLDALLQLTPRRIVMVSCNPATLARDVKLLTEAGYQASSAYPVDMFPRTKHVESVVLMTRTQCGGK